MGSGDYRTINSASTTSAIEPGSIVIWSSGYADNGAGTVGEGVSGAVAGVVVVGKQVTSSTARAQLTVQTNGIANVTVTANGGATTAGSRMILSATTASLATVAATYGTTFAGIGVRGDYLGVIFKAL